MEQMKPYDGPLMEIDSMETIYSDVAETRVRVRAKKQLGLQNGNREFPQGLFIEFFEKGKVASTLTSNFGRYYKDLNKYLVSGNVVIKDLDEGKQLNTEELFWMPAEERIFVDPSKQVIITTKTDVLNGFGLEAKEDFSKYRILNPKGTKIVNQ
jgi:LPS export ABC transporter protein LptC